MSPRHPAPIEDAIAGLASRLPVGASRGRSSVLQEAHDGLLDAAEAYEQQGCDPAEASRRAVADFGDLDELVEAYADEAVRGQARRAASVLTVGYLLNLAAWAALDALVPDRPRVSVISWATSSFNVIGILAAIITAAVFVGSRWRARRSRGGSVLAWVAGGAGALCALATLVASWLVQPWGSRPDALPGSIWTFRVEMISAVLIFGIFWVSMRCLWSAWGVSRSRRGPAAGRTAST